MRNVEQVRSWLGPHEVQGVGANGSISYFGVDSRSIRPGSLFFALRGKEPRNDGHLYLANAVRAGATHLCIERGFCGPLPTGVSVFRVEDTLRALQDCAREYLTTTGARVVAITGSIGKTSTTQLLYQLLRPHICVAVSRGNQNGQIGLPLSILNEVNDSHRWAILEMGIDAPEQMARLIEIAPPEIALLVSLEPVHIGNFSSLEEIARNKGEILCSPKTRLGLLNCQLRYLRELRALGSCHKELYGDRFGDEVALSGRLRGEEIEIFESAGPWVAPLSTHLAPHHLSCLLAAIKAARSMELSPEQIRDSCGGLQLPRGRFTSIPNSAITLIDDTYNASPPSVVGALISLPFPRGEGRRLALLAPMEELGDHRDRAHREVAECALARLDGLICLEPMPPSVFAVWRNSSKPLWRADDHSSALGILRRELRRGDVLLLKGSRKWALEQLIEPILEEIERWN